MRPGRRDFLRHATALAPLVGSAAARRALAEAALLGDGGPLAPRPGHFPAKADRFLMIFLTGGVSHVDTFDPKPKLAADQGKVVPSVDLRGTSRQPLLGSPFKFSPRGRSGLQISELFPELGALADDLCVIRTLHTDIVEHFQAVLAMHTGSATVPMPSLGSWLSHALGTLDANLPSYVVLASRLPYAGSQVWDCGFLPPIHSGVRIEPGPEPIPDLKPPIENVALRELERRMLRDVAERHAKDRPGDADLRARIASLDTAKGMMEVAPEVFGIEAEPDETFEAYGAKRGDRTSFAAQCLTARRLLERGVRVVELIDNGSSDNWDSHGNMEDHRPKALRVDRAVAALMRDLKDRGLFERTLIAICTEFGRAPWTDAPGTKGRNHYARAFSSLLAGAGVRGGTAYGETDEYGAAIVRDPCHVHDYHATILHLMGLDHTRLTYRYAGRDFRLTDVSGAVLKSILR